MTTRVEKIQNQYPEATAEEIEKALAVAGDILADAQNHRLSDTTIDYWEDYYGDLEALRELIQTEGKYLQASPDPEDKLKYEAMIAAYTAQEKLLDMHQDNVSLEQKLKELEESGVDTNVYGRIDEYESKGTLRSFDADQLELIISEGMGGKDVAGEISRQRTGSSFDYQKSLSVVAESNNLDTKLLNSCVVSEGRARGVNIDFTRPVIASREQASPWSHETTIDNNSFDREI